MNFSPFQWRPNEGYLPPPGGMAVPLFPLVVPHDPLPPLLYPFEPLPLYHPGPVVAVPPPAKKKRLDKSVAALQSVAPGESSAGGRGKTVKAAASTRTTTHAMKTETPPPLRPGTNYMYPREHTHLHIFNKASKGIWQGKYRAQPLQFKIFKASAAFTVKELVERIVKGAGSGWTVTEVLEKGNGEWLKGTTIEYDSDKAKESLKSIGWDKKRGAERPPVWLVIHKT